MRRRQLLLGVGAPALLPVQGGRSFALAWRDSFTEHWRDTREYTLAVLDAMPPDGFDLKPNPAQMSFGEQMRHLAAANAAYFNGFGIVPVEGEVLSLDRAEIRRRVNPSDKAAVRRFVAASFEYVAAVLGKLTERDLARTDLVMWKGVPAHSAIDICMRAYMHTAHHRGQAVVYLRVKGLTPPAWQFEPTAG